LVDWVLGRDLGDEIHSAITVALRLSIGLAGVGLPRTDSIPFFLFRSDWDGDRPTCFCFGSQGAAKQSC